MPNSTNSTFSLITEDLEKSIQDLTTFSKNDYIPYAQARDAARDILLAFRKLLSLNKQLQEELDNNDLHSNESNKEDLDDVLANGKDTLLNSSTISKIITDTIVAHKAMQEKSCTAIIERMPEMENENTTTNNDTEFVRAMATEIGVAGDLRLWKLRRHGQKKDGRPRIIKVHFTSKESRDTFLYKFRKSLPNFANAPSNLLVRRDMTEIELTKLHALRKEAYENNKKCGLLKYYVSDLTVKEIHDPRKFSVVV